MKRYSIDEMPDLERKPDSRVAMCELCGLRLANVIFCYECLAEPHDTITAEICDVCYISETDDTEIALDLMLLHMYKRIEEIDVIDAGIKKLEGVTEKQPIPYNSLDNLLTKLGKSL